MCITCHRFHFKGTHVHGSSGQRVCLTAGTGMLRTVMDTCLLVVVGTNEKPAFSAEVCFMKGAWLKGSQQL